MWPNWERGRWAIYKARGSGLQTLTPSPNCRRRQEPWAAPSHRRQKLGRGRALRGPAWPHLDPRAWAATEEWGGCAGRDPREAERGRAVRACGGAGLSRASLPRAKSRGASTAVHGAGESLAWRRRAGPAVGRRGDHAVPRCGCRSPGGASRRDKAESPWSGRTGAAPLRPGAGARRAEVGRATAARARAHVASSVRPAEGRAESRRRVAVRARGPRGRSGVQLWAGRGHGQRLLLPLSLSDILKPEERVPEPKARGGR